MSSNNSTALAYIIILGFIIVSVLAWNFVFKRKQINTDQAEKAIVWIGIFVVVLLTLYFEFFK